MDPCIFLTDPDPKAWIMDPDQYGSGSESYLDIIVAIEKIIGIV